ncbi:MAG: hypothetical protein GXP45_01510 [bacterium]|nr:hypothetical protein [bacterium]
MTYLGNKLKEKKTKYLRRKNRTNTIIKAKNPELRVIVQKSNRFITAQAIDPNGNVLAYISDKQTLG